MMRALVLMCLVASSVAAPAQDNEVATILKYENTNDGLGSYKFEYETSDGSSRREEGVLRNPDDPEKSFVAVTGTYSYLGPDGVVYTVTYIADENGFQPQGAHIPQAPGAGGEAVPSPPPPLFGPLPPGVIASLLGK